jgi:hypothetical protein
LTYSPNSRRKEDEGGKRERWKGCKLFMKDNAGPGYSTLSNWEITLSSFPHTTQQEQEGRK